MSLLARAINTRNLAAKKACRSSLPSSSPKRAENAILRANSLGARSASNTAQKQFMTPQTLCNRTASRLYSTQSSESESKEEETGKKVIKLTSGPNGGQREPTSDELKAMLAESERRKGFILNMAIAAFIAADILLLGFWYLASEDNPDSPGYVPEDWKSLVLTNLGVSLPQTVPIQYVGEWESEAGERIVFAPRGHFNRTENFDGSSELKTQSSGSVFGADQSYITVKTTTTERIKVSKAPQQLKDGSWAVVLDDKIYRKKSPSTSL